MHPSYDVELEEALHRNFMPHEGSSLPTRLPPGATAGVASPAGKTLAAATAAHRLARRRLARCRLARHRRRRRQLVRPGRPRRRLVWPRRWLASRRAGRRLARPGHSGSKFRQIDPTNPDQHDRLHCSVIVVDGAPGGNEFTLFGECEWGCSLTSFSMHCFFWRIRRQPGTTIRRRRRRRCGQAWHPSDWHYRDPAAVAACRALRAEQRAAGTWQPRPRKRPCPHRPDNEAGRIERGRVPLGRGRVRLAGPLSSLPRQGAATATRRRWPKAHAAYHTRSNGTSGR